MQAGDEERDIDEEAAVTHEWEYWGGIVEMKGTQWGKDWHFTLHVAEFCAALTEMINYLEDNLDWPMIYKYSPLWTW